MKDKRKKLAQRLICLVLTVILMFVLAGCNKAKEENKERAPIKTTAQTPEIQKDYIEYKGVGFYFPHGELLYNNDEAYDVGYFYVAAYKNDPGGNGYSRSYHDILKIGVVEVDQEITAEYVESRVKNYAGRDYKFYKETDSAIIYQYANVMDTSARYIQVFFKGTTTACQINLYMEVFDGLFEQKDVFVIPGYKMKGSAFPYYDEKDGITDLDEMRTPGYFLDEDKYLTMVDSITYLGTAGEKAN